MALLHAYLWFRLVRSTTGPGRLRRRLTVLTVVLAVLPVAALLSRGFLPIEAVSPLSWVGYSWLGIALYAVLALLLLEPVRLLGNLRIRRTENDEVVPSGPRRGPGWDDAAAPVDRGTAVMMDASPAPVV